MSYQVYYPGCVDDVEDHICNSCGDDVEHGRIRSVAYIKKDYLATLLQDPTDGQKWINGIANRDIIIIPEVSGTSDGGAPQEGAGYGDSDTKFLGYKFTLNYKDPNYKLNAPFYNSIKNSRNYAVAYRTETQVHISDKIASIIPKAPITEDLNSDVVWDVQVTFSQPDQPTPYDTPAGVFDECFDYV